MDAANTTNAEQAPPHPHESILMAENLSWPLTNSSQLWPQEAPHELAEKYWTTFLNTGNHANSTGLKSLLASEEMLNLEVRDAFELQAIIYCANEQHNPNLAAILVDVFEWRESTAHLCKTHPEVPEIAISRYYAEKQWLILQSEKSKTPELKRLLSDQFPRWPLQLADRRFVRKMQTWIYTIRWKFPEVLAYKINQEVFNTWSEKANAKRYFIQTAMASFLLGLPIAALFIGIYTLFGLSKNWFRDEKLFAFSFLAAQFCSFAIIAWFTIFPPTKIIRWLGYLKDDILHKPIHVYRFEKRVHFPVVGFFALISLGFLFPSPESHWQVLQTIALFISLLALLYISSADLNWHHLIGAGVVGPLIGLLVHDEAPTLDLSAIALFLVGFLLLLQRGSLSFLRWFTQLQLKKARVMWLAIVCSFFLVVADYVNESTVLNHPAMLVFSWGILVFSLQICDFYLRAGTFFISLFLLYPFSQFAIFLIPDQFTGLSCFVFFSILLNTQIIIINLLNTQNANNKQTTS